MTIEEAIRLYEINIGNNIGNLKDSEAGDTVDLNELRREACLLLSHILSKPTSWLVVNAKKNLSQQQQKEYTACLTRRATNEPLAYVIGEWGFYDDLFYVTPDVLIPRPDTEALVDWLTADSAGYRNSNPSLDVLEIGCGSGALAVTLALKSPSWRITATDISMSALRVTQSNILRHKCEVKTLRSDMFSRVTGKYDIIIANLPYISWGEMLLLPELQQEPRLALTDGADGLKLIQQLFTQAKKYLKPKGTLLIEHGYQQAVKVATLATKYGYVNPKVIYDLDQRKRALAVQKLSSYSSR